MPNNKYKDKPQHKHKFNPNLKQQVIAEPHSDDEQNNSSSDSDNSEVDQQQVVAYKVPLAMWYFN